MAGTPDQGADWDWFPNSKDRGMTLPYKRRSHSKHSIYPRKERYITPIATEMEEDG
jgi:hypothetical protein